eukprot:scaffold4704_cov54-Cyclotella_meneghiniana.AAC.2
MTFLAAVEGGGTTFIASIARVVEIGDSVSGENCFSIGETSLEIIQKATFPPHDASDEWTPIQIISAVGSFFRDNRPKEGYASLGIATFGPVGVSPSSSSYGCILNGCPKKEWRGVDLLTPLKESCQVDRVGFDTDVNAPAIAEFIHRCHSQDDSNQSVKEKPFTSLAYITIGTGVGVGLIINSSPVHGLLHPEGGHCPIHTLPNDSFKGYSWGKEKSPFGGVATVEGVASSVALTERLMAMPQMAERRGKRDKDVNIAANRNLLATLSDDHEIWTHASNAIANLCVTILLLTSCEQIVLGGGVMNRSVLYDQIRRETLKLLNGYLDVEELTDDGIERVITSSSWDLGSGLVGAFALAINSLDHHDNDVKIDAIVDKKMSRRQFGIGLLFGVALSTSCLFASHILRRRN